MEDKSLNEGLADSNEDQHATFDSEILEVSERWEIFFISNQTKITDYYYLVKPQDRWGLCFTSLELSEEIKGEIISAFKNSF